MSRRILDRDFRIGKRWPHRIFDFLPSRLLWRYLAWKGGASLPDSPFEVGKALSGADRILVALPEPVPEMLIALPAVQAHFSARPDSAIWLLAGPRETPFLASLFGRERILTLDPDRFFLGDPHYQDLMVQARGLRPNLVINFRDVSHPLLHQLLRATQAPLRVLLGEAPPVPFYNVTLAATQPVNHLRHFQMAARLWDAAGISMSGRWTRLDATADSLSRAALMLKPAGLKPESTWIFPWQDLPEGPQSALLKDVAAAARAAGHSVAVLQAEGGLFATPEPPPQVAETYPCLKTDTPGTLLALFASTAGTVGCHGPLVLLAGLTDANVTAYLREEDAPYDTSSLNGKLRVIPWDPKVATV